MKASAVSTITKSLPIGFSTLVNYSLLATLGLINLFCKKIKRSVNNRVDIPCKRFGKMDTIIFLIVFQQAGYNTWQGQ